MLSGLHGAIFEPVLELDRALELVVEERTRLVVYGDGCVCVLVTVVFVCMVLVGMCCRGVVDDHALCAGAVEAVVVATREQLECRRER